MLAISKTRCLKKEYSWTGGSGDNNGRIKDATNPVKLDAFTDYFAWCDCVHLNSLWSDILLYSLISYLNNKYILYQNLNTNQRSWVSEGRFTFLDRFWNSFVIIFELIIVYFMLVYFISKIPFLTHALSEMNKMHRMFRSLDFSEIHL